MEKGNISFVGEVVGCYERSGAGAAAVTLFSIEALPCGVEGYRGTAVLEGVAHVSCTQLWYTENADRMLGGAG